MEAIIKCSRTPYTYGYLWSTANLQREHAENCERKGETFYCIATLVFAAFTIEAYLNHIGPKCLRDKWNDWWSTKDKLQKLTDHIGLKPDYSVRPYETFHELFRFRDEMAHGKTKTAKSAPVIKNYDSEAIKEYPETWWESRCTLSYIDRAITDTESIITELHKAAGLEGYPFGTLAVGEWEASTVPEILR